MTLLVGLAFPKAMTPSNIQAGFRVCGIVLVNVNIFTDKKFLPSVRTDRPLSQTNESEEATTSEIWPMIEGSSTNQHDLEVPTTSVITPEQIGPFKKTGARKKKCTRKLGNTRILTDTPEKN